MFCFAIVLALLSPASGPSTEPSVELPQEIRAALSKSAEQMGPITISFTLQNSSRYTPAEAKEKLKLDDWTAAFNAGAHNEYKFEWQDGKYRSWSHDMLWPGKPEHMVGE